MAIWLYNVFLQILLTHPCFNMPLITVFKAVVQLSVNIIFSGFSEPKSFAALSRQEYIISDGCGPTSRPAPAFRSCKPARPPSPEHFAAGCLRCSGQGHFRSIRGSFSIPPYSKSGKDGSQRFAFVCANILPICVIENTVGILSHH